jgi:transcription antitermination factor NusG
MAECLLRWFAVTVKPQHERATAEQLQAKALEAYVPLYRDRRRWSDRVKTIEVPLFLRYVFCRFDCEDRARVLKTPGVLSIVSFDGKPCPVSDEEIHAVKTMVDSGMPVTVWPYVRAGQRVRIREGSMSGLEGILVREKAGYRIVVNVELLNRGVAVEIERDLVEPAGGGRPSRPADLHPGL